MSGPPGILEILLIGHSLVGTTMPPMLDTVIQARHGTGQVQAQVINGAPLRFNWDHPESAQGVDARAALAQGGHGTVVMTEAIPLVNHTTWNDTHGYATLWYDLAISANPQAQVFLYETWHDLRSGTGAEVEWDDNAHIPWRERLDLDLPQWQGIVDHVNDRRAPGDPAMRLLPAGQAMARLHDEIAAGTVPGLDGIEDVFHDTIHPNDIGSYFVVMVKYAAITGESPVGLPRITRNRYGGTFEAPAPELAERLQHIAWTVVQEFERSRRAEAPADARQATVTAAGAMALDRPDNPSLALGLSSVTDWAVQQPFMDVMKTAREWIGHLPGEWGGVTHADLEARGLLDPDGWPLAVPEDVEALAALVLTDLPEEAVSLAGRYRAQWEGTGDLELLGRVANVTRGQQEIRFDFTPGEGLVILTLRDTDLDRSGDHLRNLTIVHERHLDAFDAGALFNPDWIAHIAPFRVLRMMDWMEANDSPIATWQDRPKPGDYSWARKGVPLEVMLRLANETGIEPWFTLPHLADDDFIRRFAETVRDGLDPERTVWVELSNEVWNWQFEQAHWAEAQARARWGVESAWVQFYGLRAAEMARIWAEVFAAVGQRDRLMRVIATQTGWLGLEEDVLGAPLFVAEDRRLNAPPAEAFDAYAIAGYFSAGLGMDAKVPAVHGWLRDSAARAEAEGRAQGLSGAALDAHVARHRFDHAVTLAAQELRDGSITGDPGDSLADFLGRTLPHHARVARRHGLQLVMYEGGTHVVGVGRHVEDDDLTAFFTHLNYTEEMGALYDTLLQGWKDGGGTLFNAFVDAAAPSRWGSWGALRHLDDDNPRWRALQRFNRTVPAWW